MSRFPAHFSRSRESAPASPRRNDDLMAKRLNPDDLKVESFTAGTKQLLSVSPQMDCTGCDSGCGIFPEG
ncbi:MAG TPA: hypothetical protein VE913_01510 [Longimicrobium sp.]|nr:hypothetical protein [Longimicrobium sp.]